MNKEDRKDLVTENMVEDAAKAAFTKAQSVYRADHDHFPLKHTWETTLESVREGWRAIAYAAVEAAVIPPLGTQPEPRRIRSVVEAEPDLLSCLKGYMQVVEIMNLAMKDGINVQGAVAGLIGWEDMAKAAISKAEGHSHE